MPPVFPGAIVPSTPFRSPVPIPTLGTGDVTVTFDQAWLPYIIGACKALVAASTWDPPTQTDVANTIFAAYDLLKTLSGAAPPVPAVPFGCGDDCMGCAQLRFNGCVLEQFDCVTQLWVPVPTVGSCVPNTAPGGGITPPSPTKCQDYQLQFDANALTVLPFLVNSGDTLQINAIKGAGSDGTPTWFCPDGGIFFGGACVGGSFTSGSDPIPTSPHMSVLLKIGSNYYPFFTTTLFTVPGGVTNAQIYIGVNDASIGDDSGQYSIDFNYCNNQSAPVGSWRAHIDFTLNSGGFSVIPYGSGSAGVWTPGSGWVGSGNVNGGVYSHGVYIKLTLASATNVTSAETKGDWSSGGTTTPANVCFEFQDQGANNLIPTETFATMPTPTFDLSGSGHSGVDQFNLLVFDCELFTSCAGSSTVTDLYLAGTGTIPPELAAFSY